MHHGQLALPPHCPDQIAAQDQRAPRPLHLAEGHGIGPSVKPTTSTRFPQRLQNRREPTTQRGVLYEPRSLKRSSSVTSSGLRTALRDPREAGPEPEAFVA